ncbi:tRNA (N6-threonylcarbamoyladenosine(37)-N6)-methyltransferase TrmO [Paracoccus limosus]|jgi:tRNA-Thr(GGU) m(6)t(6)A37 methyltransferase TsaA|uniref:tRNA (N6-threonylcarbamoyladenosine(37)-N6)-methyltransferase TrmO n=1 Tax=Paracoccus limosus TaxID=913252 RepID=A0A844H733_9RHOB|nr:SAM-dependent methyltransferase [Paracoccus limosus]MTH34297.1 tRNA (N6-threonylcarbamoyladenosine(37)-N6)-methyltransferase TrmO [Paracoccus limosus]
MSETADALRPHELAVETPQGFDAGLWFIGRIRTPWTRRGDCPHRGDAEAGPDCRIELSPRWQVALTGIEAHERLQILYWMDQARRDLVLQNPKFGAGATGTFALRSPVRPNPVASSVVRLLAVEGTVLTVRGLDCLDGTPLIDIKAAFGALA